MPKGGVANRAIKALNVLPGQHKLGKGKRFKFLTFQDLINRVDVSRDVYRDTTTKLQLAPADGAESFFQQYLAEWSELDLTADFKTFANEVYPLSQSLAQLLHYRKRVVRSLLGQLRQPRCTCSPGTSSRSTTSCTPLCSTRTILRSTSKSTSLTQ